MTTDGEPEAAVLPCIRCGYDLRALALDGVCPECGTSIARSSAGDRLAFADPAWLARLARGQTVLAVGLRSLVVLIVLFIVLPISLAWLASSAGTTGMTVFRAVLLALGWGSLMALGAAGVGAFLVTAQDPRETLVEPPSSARRTARAAMAIVIVAAFAGHALDLLAPITPARSAITAIMLVALVAAATVGLAALLRWLGRLAVRLPDDDLSRETQRLGRFFSRAMPLVLLPRVGDLLDDLAAGAARPGVAYGLSATAIGLKVGGGLAFLVILVRLGTLSRLMLGYRRAFRQALGAR